MTVTHTHMQTGRQAKGKSGKRISERGEGDSENCVQILTPVPFSACLYVQEIIIRDLLKFFRTFSPFDVSTAEAPFSS